MEYRISDRFRKLKPSAIREILKHTSGTDVIPFAAGNPSPEAFPAKEIVAITQEILSRPAPTYLQYGITEGYAPLRDFLKADLAKKGIKAATDELITVSGAQQGIDLTAQVFCDPGDVIICENPSFIGSLNAFRSHGIELCGVPMQPDGMDLNALEKVMREQKRAKLLYIIPNFQNPTGITTDDRKRREIYNLAAKYGIVIVEDNPYGDLRFAGTDVASIKSMDDRGLVVYCGSFSKLIAPGMRVGYLLANSEIISKVTVAKQAADVHTNLLAQITVYEFLSRCNVDAHIAKIRDVYRRKYLLMEQGLKAHVSPKVSFTKPQGGLFILGYLPQGTDIAALCKACIDKKLAIVPGGAFSVNPEEPSYTVRLNYCTPSDEQIERGCEILGEVIAQMI